MNEKLYLKDIAKFIKNGRTPQKKDYLESPGKFIVKVGNLTGDSINWSDGDRNFISNDEFTKREKSEYLIVQEGDILLTSSAHSKEHIAKKIDYVSFIPSQYENCSFVGEIMLIRVSKEYSFAVYQWLNQPLVKKSLMDMVTGQTAHLYPSQVENLQINPNLLSQENISFFNDMRDKHARMSIANYGIFRQLDNIRNDCQSRFI